MARPTKYKPRFVKDAFKYALLYATDEDMARCFEIDVATLNRWKRKYPKFCAAIKEAKEQADAKIADSLYQRAHGYSHPETIYMTVTGPRGTGSHIEKIETIKHYPPDATSMIFWLKNRQPKLYRDKQDVEHSGEIKVTEIKIPPQKNIGAPLDL